MTLFSRRNFMVSLATPFLAAPAIVRAASLMPVKVLPPEPILDTWLEPFWGERDEIQELQARLALAYKSTYEQLTADLFGDFSPRTKI